MHMLSRLAALLAALLLAGCSADAGEISAVPVPLDRNQPDLRQVGDLEFLGGLRLSGGGVGGLSAMLVDGDVVTAVSDTANWFRFRLVHDAEGRLVGAVAIDQGVLKNLDGRPITSKRAGDAESMARVAEGIVVGFEHQHRLWLYAPDLAARPRPLQAPPGLAALPPNGGIEALAELPDGRLLMLAEEGGGPEHVPGWIGRPGQWEEFRYRRTGTFKPTGAAPLPDGRVVVLERRFSLLGGVAARLAVLDPEAVAAGAMVESEELGRLEPPLLVDNFEAVAALRRPDGRTVLYIMSDDNFSPLQSTLLLHFALR